VSFVTFIIAGFVQNWIICLAIGAVLIICTLFVIKRTTTKRDAVQ